VLGVHDVGSDVISLGHGCTSAVIREATEHRGGIVGGVNRDWKLSPKQRALLARCAAGEDRELPERYDPGPPPFVRPAMRWFVPPGLVVPNGSAEYQAARVLRARGLLKFGGVPPSPELPYGQGGYLLTKKGRKALV
jgi:hypothetical protein